MGKIGKAIWKVQKGYVARKKKRYDTTRMVSDNMISSKEKAIKNLYSKR